MQSLKYTIFFLLISFTFQLDHCIQTAKICKSNLLSKESGSIANCIIYYSENPSKCYLCDIGYALSYEEDKCISFPLCGSLKEGNKECDSCYPGYYLKNNACAKIQIKNCESSDDGDICTYCQDYSKKNEDGSKCDLFNLIEGCRDYNDNGDCFDCEDDYELSESGSGIEITCTFKSCDDGDKVVQYCQICEDGYYSDPFDDGKCKPYQTDNSNNSGKNEIRCCFLLSILILTLLI